MDDCIEQFIRAVISERRVIPLPEEEVKVIAQKLVDSVEEWALSVPDESSWRDVPMQGWGFGEEGKFVPSDVHEWNFTTVDGRDGRVLIILRGGVITGKDRRMHGKYVLGGEIHSLASKGEPRRGFKIYINLDLSKTPNEILNNMQEIRKDLTSVLRHEMTHARDRIVSGGAGSSGVVSFDKGPFSEYHNLPEEVRAYSRQIVDEIEEPFMDSLNLHRDEIEDKSDPGWAKATAQSLRNSDSVDRYIRQSRTWDHRRVYWTAGNKRLVRQLVATRVSELWDEHVAPMIDV